MDFVQHPDGKTYRLVGNLDEEQQAPVRERMKRQRRAQREREGLVPVPPETHGLPPGYQP